MPKIFGTDGIRDEVNKNFMTPENIVKLGQSLKIILSEKIKPKVFIGKDTRLSCSMFEASLISGLTSVGIDVVLLGVIPTSGVALLTRFAEDSDMGIMISASHNEYIYNGIKFFDGLGNKITEETEKKIEQYISSDLTSHLVTAENIGEVTIFTEALNKYIEHVKKTFPASLNLNGLKIVIDSANGAAYNIVREIFEPLGAKLFFVGDKPNGVNINENVGVCNILLASQLLLMEKCDLALILDGDADRLAILNERGELVAGDQIIALLAKFLSDEGKLANNVIITTIMSNMALDEYLQKINIKNIRADVGDKNVAKLMRQYRSNLGGEESGHIILGDHVTTGDGVISALQILTILSQRRNEKISEICQVFNPSTQLKLNLKIVENILDVEKPEFEGFLSDITSKLKGKSKIIVRKSGTEPLIRVMVETDDLERSKEILQEIEEKILKGSM